MQPALKRLFLIGVPLALDSQRWMQWSAYTSLAATHHNEICRQGLALVDCRLSPASLSALARMLESRSLTMLHSQL